MEPEEPEFPNPGFSPTWWISFEQNGEQRRLPYTGSDDAVYPVDDKARILSLGSAGWLGPSVVIRKIIQPRDIGQAGEIEAEVRLHI